MNSEKFCLNDYDCIGFDLDCTLAEYNVKELMKLEYELIVNYLIEKKSYDREIFLDPYEENEFFIQKGLFMDFRRGNILKISRTGSIIKACHGTKLLEEEKIIQEYGENKVFVPLKEFVKDPLSIINTPFEKVVRTTLDCFDTPCLLIFGKIIDYLDSKGNVTEYNIWPDILEGLYHLYSRNHFATGDSLYFATMRENSAKYYKKWDDEKLKWLKEVKSKKFIFLLTGSYYDFASLTSSFCISENWQDYFDVILCYARKPFFFVTNRPFLKTENNKETEAVEKNELQLNSVYSQGSWEELKALIVKQTKKNDPKCLYIGDNLIQDVFAPVNFKCCDSVAVSLELQEEFRHSRLWDSYFGNEVEASYWNYLITSYAKICISSLDVFVKKPLNFHYNCLTPGEKNETTESNGFYCS